LLCCGLHRSMDLVYCFKSFDFLRSIEGRNVKFFVAGLHSKPRKKRLLGDLWRWRCTGLQTNVKNRQRVSTMQHFQVWKVYHCWGHVLIENGCVKTCWCKKYLPYVLAGHTINRVLASLEALDKQNFDKIVGDPVDSLYHKIFDYNAGKDNSEMQVRHNVSVQLCCIFLIFVALENGLHSCLCSWQNRVKTLSLVCCANGLLLQRDWGNTERQL